MPNLARLPIKAEDGYLRVVIETPRGSHAKLAYSSQARRIYAFQVTFDGPNLSLRLGLHTVHEGR